MLELKNVKKSYGKNEVLKGISLDVKDGEIVSVLGPSGCEKTTLLNTILEITDITDGKIIFDGEDITHKPMEKRGFNCFSGLCVVSESECIQKYCLWTSQRP